MSGFDAINEDIRNSGGNWVKLSKVENDPVDGVIVDVQKREKVFKGKKVMNAKTGEPRIEWVFTFDVQGEIKKWNAGETAQWAIRNALAEGQKLEKGGRLKVKVTKSSVQGESQPEFDVSYESPKVQELADDDTPF